MPAKKYRLNEDGEPAGRMVNNHGHWEYRYDDPALNPPVPPLRVVAPPPSPTHAAPSDGDGCADPAARRGDSSDCLRDPTAPALRPRHDGWTAERQRTFLTVLAETGSISLACAQAGIAARSAYRLRAHPAGVAFAQAWDAALKLATARLTSLAYERATRGTVKETFVDGELKVTTRAPSDKLLMFLLGHLLPAGRPGDRWTGFEAMASEARAAFPDQLAALSDQAIDMVPLEYRDFFPERPGDQTEDA